jgi:hypothetical protein
MSQRNPSREIAFSIALAVALGAGLYAYISSSIERPKPPVLVAPPAMDAGARDTRAEDARRVATAFVQHLSAARYDDAYLMMANAYRQMTPVSAFRGACTASPFLSTAASVSISRTRQERAPGQEGRGSLSATGVLATRSGNVDVTFYFVDDPAGVAIVNVNVAGAPALPMGSAAANDAAPAPNQRREMAR